MRLLTSRSGVRASLGACCWGNTLARRLANPRLARRQPHTLKVASSILARCICIAQPANIPEGDRAPSPSPNHTPTRPCPNTSGKRSSRVAPMHGGRARGLPGGLYLARGFSGQWSREYALRAEVLLMAGSSSTVGVFLRVILSVPGRRTQARIPATSCRATALQRVFPRASDLRGACLRMSMGVWRNGSASGFRAAGWEFASLCPHIAEMGTRLCVCVIPAKCVCIT